jgi:hypothetical protein
MVHVRDREDPPPPYTPYNTAESYYGDSGSETKYRNRRRLRQDEELSFFVAVSCLLVTMFLCLRNAR